MYKYYYALQDDSWFSKNQKKNEIIYYLNSLVVLMVVGHRQVWLYCDASYYFNKQIYCEHSDSFPKDLCNLARNK